MEREPPVARDKGTAEHDIPQLLTTMEKQRQELREMRNECAKGAQQISEMVAATMSRMPPAGMRQAVSALPVCAPVAPLFPVQTPSLIPSLMSLKLSPPPGWKPEETSGLKAKPRPSERPAVASSEPKLIFCWNCGDTSHAWVRCPKPLQVFCRWCGRWGVSKPDCPECREVWLRERKNV